MAEDDPFDKTQGHFTAQKTILTSVLILHGSRTAHRQPDRPGRLAPTPICSIVRNRSIEEDLSCAFANRILLPSRCRLSAILPLGTVFDPKANRLRFDRFWSLHRGRSREAERFVTNSRTYRRCTWYELAQLRTRV